MRCSRIILTVLCTAFFTVSCNQDVGNLIYPPANEGQNQGSLPQNPKPEPTPTPSTPSTCRVLISESDFNRFASEKQAVLENAFIDPGPLQTCFDSARNKITGYNSLVVYSPLRVTSEPRFVNGQIEVPIATSELDDSFRSAVAQEFGLSSEASAALSLQKMHDSQYPFEAHASAGSLPRTRLHRKQIGSETVLVLSRKKSLKEKRARAFLNGFAKGKKNIAVFLNANAAGVNAENASVLLHAPEHQKKNSYARISKLAVLKEHWRRADLVTTDPDDPNPAVTVIDNDDTANQERDEVLGIAIQWQYHLSRIAPDVVRRELEPMITYALERWIPRSPEPAPETAFSDLTRLGFLGTLFQEHAEQGILAPYFRQMRRLEPYFGQANATNAYPLLREIIDIVDHGTLTQTQLEQIQTVASRLSQQEFASPAVWNKAKEVCARLAFDSKKIARFDRMITPFAPELWRSQWEAATTAVLELLLRRPELPDDKFSLLADAFAWGGYHEENPFPSPSVAISHAECLVFDRNIDAAKLTKLRESFRVHLSLGFSALLALEHAERELLDRVCAITP